MAQTIREVLKITGLGKWGPKVGDEYLSWSKNIKDADKGKVVPGGEYECELYIADSGKRYINSVKGVSLPSIATGNSKMPSLPKPEVKAEVKPGVHAAAKLSDAMTRTDWELKDKRIGRAGVIQVAVQVSANFDDAVELANKMLKFIATDNVNQD